MNNKKLKQTFACMVNQFVSQTQWEAFIFCVPHKLWNYPIFQFVCLFVCYVHGFSVFYTFFRGGLFAVNRSQHSFHFNNSYLLAITKPEKTTINLNRVLILKYFSGDIFYLCFWAARRFFLNPNLNYLGYWSGTHQYFDEWNNSHIIKMLAIMQLNIFAIVSTGFFFSFFWISRIKQLKQNVIQFWWMMTILKRNLTLYLCISLE